MVYRGRVIDGAVVLDSPAVLPEGAEVDVMVVQLPEDTGGSVPTLFEQFKAFIGTAQSLPADASSNHDHYLHGAPKRP